MKKRRDSTRHPDMRGGNSEGAALAGFLPCVARWFRTTFDKPAPAQTMA